ncbi:MAG: hypothetical protein RBR54_11170 [Sulfurimonas sp.]|jgi:adenosine deaminase|nr:hypothetical protein [Sulfurimonas sp.]
MKPLLATTHLDSHRLLEHYYLKGFFEDAQRLEEYLFVELHAKDPYKPDYIFKNAMADFTKGKSLGALTLDSFKELSQMLEFRGERAYVKSASFARWQEIILTVSPLAIISYAIYEKSGASFRIESSALIASIFNKSALPSPYEPQLDAMIARERLNEMHMHLNGATEADIVWHDALNRPNAFYNHLAKSFAKSNVTEQYLQIGAIEQADIFRLLTIARQLRDTMVRVMFDGHTCTHRFTRDSYDIGATLYYASHIHPMREATQVDFTHAWQYESLFLIKAFEHLQSTQNIHFSHLLHYYLLIYAFFQKILVQQKMQVGFDQFQKITENEVRELTEEQYHLRYRQLHGMYDTSLEVLEGRFAPKEDLQKSHKLLKAIRDGYDKNEKSFKLLLVPHFIKLRDNRNPKNIITFRDLALRLKNKKSLEMLLETIKHPKYKELVVGFDAAANELHASPEAFAPIFRKLRFLGYSNFTYHAGEDYIHLLSGLRMVYEAVEFLDMSTGNRIGHATALGIDPKLWIQRLYESKLTIKKGEWLDNLIFAYELLQNHSAYYGHLGKLESDIFRYFQEIYNPQKAPNIHQIIASWRARKYDPFVTLRWRDPSLFEEFEIQELCVFNRLDETTKGLYEQYHTGECIERANTMIQVAPDHAPFTEKLLRDMQNIMIEHLNTKNIAIETLPTSNVRISYYKRYDEHHLWRWLGLENYREGDPMPTVVVGSDDTGIFMTNLRNEYAHIYQTLCKSKNQQVALHTIKQLNKNGKAFTFQQ